jgi:hypothetical protein
MSDHIISFETRNAMLMAQDEAAGNGYSGYMGPDWIESFQASWLYHEVGVLWAVDPDRSVWGSLPIQDED